MDKEKARDFISKNFSFTSDSFKINSENLHLDSFKSYIKKGDFLNIGSYVSMESEVSTRRINEFLMDSNFNLFLPKIDADSSDGKIHSRIGLVAEAESVDRDFNFFDFVSNDQINRAIHCILIDEVQFLTKYQIRQVCKISDELNIPAMCYGIRTDFQGKLFEGSAELLALADNLIELKTVCDCGRKAIMVVRLDEDGNIVKDGDQIKIGGNDSYKVCCRKHFREFTQLI